MATRFVRVRDNTSKQEISVSTERAKRLVERGGDVEILDGVSAVDSLGRALPATPVKAPAKSSKETDR